MERLVALVLAVLVFVLFAQTWHRYVGESPSPVDTPPLWDWVKRLLSRDPEPEPDPEPDPGRKGRGYRLRPVDDARTDVDWIDYNTLPPAVPLDQPEASRRQQWVADALARRVRPVDIIAQGTRLFAASESTIKREIRNARARARADR